MSEIYINWKTTPAGVVYATTWQEGQRNRRLTAAAAREMIATGKALSQSPAIRVEGYHPEDN